MGHVTCGRCNGSKKIGNPNQAWWEREQIPCPSCNANGEVYSSSEEKCDRCGGDGWIYGDGHFFDRVQDTCPECRGRGGWKP